MKLSAWAKEKVNVGGDGEGRKVAVYDFMNSEGFLSGVGGFIRGEGRGAEGRGREGSGCLCVYSLEVDDRHTLDTHCFYTHFFPSGTLSCPWRGFGL